MAATQKADLSGTLGVLAAGVAPDIGVEVVDLVLRRAGRRWLLRIDIDRPGPEGVGIEQCQRFSRALEALLDEQETIPASYTLEVSSPGIDRPIETPDDVRRNTGRHVTVEAENEADGRRAYDGVLVGMDGDALVVRPGDGGEDVRVPLAEIILARQHVPF